MNKKRHNVIKTFIFLLYMNYAQSTDREITVSVEPGKEDCFFETVKKGEMIDVEYQVIDGGHGDLDITFRVANPQGRMLVTDFKKSENNHRVPADVDGDYRFCLDNTFSSFNSKTIFLELIVENEDDEWESEENLDLKTEEAYELQIQDILEAISNVRGHLIKVRHYQDFIKSVEARDRNIAEENNFKVNTFSMVQIFVMLLVGVVQVVMVRSLFDEKSRVHKLWKKFVR